jgi:methoxymalonate biosynthesis acyl carrier protein
MREECPVSNTAYAGKLTEEATRTALTDFLELRTKRVWGPTTDLFASGAVTSIFAMELVVHVEQTFGVTIEGDELNMENFRTVDAMVAMIFRLRAGAPRG